MLSVALPNIFANQKLMAKIPPVKFLKIQTLSKITCLQQLTGTVTSAATLRIGHWFELYTLSYRLIMYAHAWLSCLLLVLCRVFITCDCESATLLVICHETLHTHVSVNCQLIYLIQLYFLLACFPINCYTVHNS